MDIKSLEYFYTLAEGATFLEASEIHSISQSSLSKIIRKLEGELGVQLFDRSSRTAVLTPAGRCLYRDLSRLRPYYQEMKNHLSSYSKHREITCCALPSFTVLGLRHILHEFTVAHPEIAVKRIDLRDPRRVKGILERREVDFVIMHRPFMEMDCCEFTYLKDDYLVAILPLRHPLAGQEVVHLKDLQKETLWVNEWSSFIVRDAFSAAGLSPNMRKTSLNREELLQNALRGESISLFFRSDFDLFSLSGVAVLKIAEYTSTPFVLASPKGQELSESLAIFRDYLTEALQKGNHT